MAGKITEREIIKKIRENAVISADGLVRGIGDDCSVFGEPGASWLVSTDMLVDSVHFDRSWHEPHLLGRKSVAVNLSDIAAMGGAPKFMLISMSLPAGIGDAWILSWFEGVTEILEEHDCLLIGGDTVSGGELSFSLTVLGTQLPEGPIYRSGAREGESVYVSGALGSSAAGLALLRKIQQRKIAEKRSEWEEVLSAHLNPSPQIELGKLLCRSRYVSAMQDISDGLATDLGHICCESGVRAEIEEDKLPSLALLDGLCSSYDMVKRDLLLRGGDDYQLVFTVKKGCEGELETLVKRESQEKIHRVGVLRNGRGVFLRNSRGRREEISFSGYEHTVR